MLVKEAVRLSSLAVFAACAIQSMAFPAAATGMQKELQAPGPLGSLRGTLLMPTDKARAVMLIVPGSGPTDRDGHNSLAGETHPYRLLAEGLAGRGIGSTRIDKRGLFGSSAAVADADAVTIDDYAADVRSWIRVLRKETGLPCVWLAGHSEGGLVVLVAAQDTSDICGLVLLAAPGRRLSDVLRSQLRSHLENTGVRDEALHDVEELEKGRRISGDGMSPELLALFRPGVQGLLISEMSYDPAKLIAKVARPILILQGKQDKQVSAIDAQRLKSAAPGARLVWFDHADHVFKSVDMNDQGNFVERVASEPPLAAGVVDAAADFVLAATAR
jgi:uncharacterized protein